MKEVLPGLMESSKTFEDFLCRRLWVALQDENDDIKEVATNIWVEFEFTVEEELCGQLLVKIKMFCQIDLSFLKQFINTR